MNLIYQANKTSPFFKSEIKKKTKTKTKTKTSYALQKF